MRRLGIAGSLLLGALALAGAAHAQTPLPDDAPKPIEFISADSCWLVIHADPPCKVQEARKLPQGSPEWYSAWRDVAVSSFYGSASRAEYAAPYFLLTLDGEDPDIDARFHAARGNALLVLNRKAEALAEIRRALRLIEAKTGAGRAIDAAASDPEMFAALFRVLLPMKAPEGLALQKALALPVADRWTVSVSYSELLYAARMPEQALAHLQRALDGDPEHPGLVESKCVLLRDLGRMREAEPVCAEIADYSRMGMLAYADALEGTGQIGKARAARASAAMNPYSTISFPPE